MDAVRSAYEQTRTRFAQAFRSYDQLGFGEAGPLDAKTRRIIRFCVACESGAETKVRNYTRNALREGISPEELRQAVVLTVDTGDSRSIPSITWVEETMTSALG